MIDNVIDKFPTGEGVCRWRSRSRVKYVEATWASADFPYGAWRDEFQSIEDGRAWVRKMAGVTEGDTEILPCPFCDGEPEVTTRHEEDAVHQWTTYYVECMTCRVSVPTFDGRLTEAEAIEQWNLRGRQGYEWYNRGGDA